MSMELYKEQIEKQAGLESLGTLAKGILPKIEGFAGKSLATRALTGAAVGAGIKGLTYQPPQGQQSTIGGRLGAMAGGALTGGITGAAFNPETVGAAKGLVGKAKSLMGPKLNGSAMNLVNGAGI